MTKERIIRPSWNDLQELVRSAGECLLICSPYYSKGGLGHLQDAIPNGPSFTFVGRLSPSDWVNGVADPEALASLLNHLREKGQEASFVVHQQLHAKAYLSDRLRGFVGSANLSRAGFDKNFEIMVRLGRAEASAVDDLIQVEAARYGKRLDAETLGMWVDGAKDSIEEIRRNQSDAEDLADIQRTLDHVLGYGQNPVAGDAPDVEEYLRWLDGNNSLAGANVLSTRGWNLDGQNLTGHFRQSYFAVAHFLRDHPEYVSRLSEELDELRGPNPIYQPVDALLSDWIDHVNEHATESGDAYDYAVLRSIMPANLGGTRMGGGGGSSTLKRSFPLVARFMAEQR